MAAGLRGQLCLQLPLTQDVYGRLQLRDCARALSRVLLPATDAAPYAVGLSRMSQPPVHYHRVVRLASTAQPVERREAAWLATCCALELDHVGLDELLRHAHVAQRDILR